MRIDQTQKFLASGSEILSGKRFEAVQAEVLNVEGGKKGSLDDAQSEGG